MVVGGEQSARGKGFAASFPWQALSLRTKSSESPACPSTSVYLPGETVEGTLGRWEG